MQTSSFVANPCGSAHLFDRGGNVSGPLFVALSKRCIEAEWNDQNDAFCWWVMILCSWDQQEKLRHAGRAAYGFAEWALWQEIQAHNPLCLQICYCSFQTFGAVLMIQRWRTTSKVKGHASLFSASLFEGIHSVHRDANSHWEIPSAVTKQTRTCAKFWCDKKPFLFLFLSLLVFASLGSPARDRQTFGVSGPASSLCWKNVVCCLRRHAASLLSRCGGLLVESLVVWSPWVAGETEDG